MSFRVANGLNSWSLAVLEVIWRKRTFCRSKTAYSFRRLMHKICLYQSVHINHSLLTAWEVWFLFRIQLPIELGHLWRLYRPTEKFTWNFSSITKWIKKIYLHYGAMTNSIEFFLPKHTVIRLRETKYVPKLLLSDRIFALIISFRNYSFESA